jgi:predicted dehydrogenase
VAGVRGRGHDTVTIAAKKGIAPAAGEPEDAAAALAAEEPDRRGNVVRIGQEAEMAEKKLRVLVVGLGNMGMSHALAYTRIPGFEVVGVCERRIATRELPDALGNAAGYDNFETALAELKPDVVSINTLPDTHAQFAMKAMEAGAHVFVEKPIADTAENAEKTVATARRTGRKLVVGYILRQHPSWVKFIEIAQQLGTPLVFRMNLNQQSNGETWEWHKRLLNSFPPIVDCGVHYVDVMCQMTKAKPVKVHAIGAALTDEVAQQNYGMLQVIFDDGSVGWYEAGWGPMMSETAFFVKDVIGPKGSVSIVMAETAGNVKSDDINAHTRTSQILWHHADMKTPDTRIDMSDEPSHDDLCERQQRYLLKAIRDDLDLTGHMDDAVKSLKIVLAAERSIHEGQIIPLT